MEGRGVVFGVPWGISNTLNSIWRKTVLPTFSPLSSKFRASKQDLSKFSMPRKFEKIVKLYLNLFLIIY